MNSKTLGGAAALAALLTFAALGDAIAAPQPAPPPTVAPAPQQRTPTFTPPPIMDVNAPENKLHLTVAQQNKNNAIMSGFYKKLMALRSNKNQTQAQMQAAFISLQKATHAQVVAVLTPAQKTQLAEIQATRTQYATGANAAKMKAMQYDQQLSQSLTAAQKAKIAAIKQSAVAQLQTLSANRTMTIEQKQQQGYAIQTGAQAKIKAVLTPSQLATYANLQRYVDQYNSLFRLAQQSGV